MSLIFIVALPLGALYGLVKLKPHLAVLGDAEKAMKIRLSTEIRKSRSSLDVFTLKARDELRVQVSVKFGFYSYFQFASPSLRAIRRPLTISPCSLPLAHVLSPFSPSLGALQPRRDRGEPAIAHVPPLQEGLRVVVRRRRSDPETVAHLRCVSLPRVDSGMARNHLTSAPCRYAALHACQRVPPLLPLCGMFQPSGAHRARTLQVQGAQFSRHDQSLAEFALFGDHDDPRCPNVQRDGVRVDWR